MGGVDVREDGSEAAWSEWDLAVARGDGLNPALDVAGWVLSNQTDLVAITERIERAEREAFYWHVISRCMTPQEREGVEQIGDLLRAANPRAEAAPSLLGRLRSLLGR